MIHYLDEYRKARRVGENQGDKREDIDPPRSESTAAVFKFRHPRDADRRPAAVDPAQAEIEQNLDFVYALASQS